jgi:hypothetical protein
VYSDGRSQNALLANFAPFDCCACVKIKKRSDIYDVAVHSGKSGFEGVSLCGFY